MTERQADARSDTFPRLSARTARFTLGVPTATRISPDGQQVIFLRARTGTDRTGLLWSHDVPTGTETLLADPDTLLAGAAEDLPNSERARRERARQSGAGITGYSVDEQFRAIAFALSGRLFVVGTLTQTVAEVPVTAAVVDPQISPDGRSVAFHSDGAVHVVAVTGAAASHVLAESDDSAVTWGLADFVHAEELGRDRAYWWAPTSDSLLVTRTDESLVQQWHISDPANPDHPPAQVRYPVAGSVNPTTQLWQIRLDDDRTLIWDGVDGDYLVDVQWRAGHGALISTLSRDQRDLRVHAWEPGSVPTLLRQVHDPAWVDVVPGTPTWLGDRLLTVEPDRDVDAYRLLADGEALLPEDIQVRAVVNSTKEGTAVSVSTVGIDRRLLWVRPDGSWRWLDEPDGVTLGTSNAGTSVLRTETLRDVGSRVTVQRDGTTSSIAVLAERAPFLPTPVLLAKDQPDDPRVAVLLPRSGPRARLPVLLDPYGGPHGQQVLSSARSYLEHQWWADQGYLVVVADGPGTPGPPAWERAMAGRFAEPALHAQVRALELAQHSLGDRMDLDRVAIRGWSFGGYLAALAVLRRPDLFHAAVAGAPVTDWTLYDTAYTERYLGHPRDYPDRYAAESLIEDAGELSRPLMLIHGTSDDNVVLAHTLRLSAALLAAGRGHQVLPLSGVTHMTPQEEVAENLLLLQRDFLAGALDAQGRGSAADPGPSGTSP